MEEVYSIGKVCDENKSDEINLHETIDVQVLRWLMHLINVTVISSWC